jgi:two-component system sensor histidine kinase QseC
MGRYSLHRRLLVLLLGVGFLAWTLGTGLAYRHAHDELDELLDARIARSARALMAQEPEVLERVRIGALPEEGPYDHEYAIQAWRDGKGLILRSSSAPASRLSPVETGFSDATVDGRRWRVYSGWDGDRCTLIQVAEAHALRDRLLLYYTLSSVPALLIGLPFLGLAVWLIVSAAVRPIVELGQEVSRRGPADLHPLANDGAPVEVDPLIDRLNALFARLGDSIQSERRFTSYAAHELRTPIAAIRAQAEVARDGRDARTRDLALERVIEGCDRASRLVEQMLLLARIDERIGHGHVQATRLDLTAARVIANLTPGALQHGVTLELATDEEVTVAADRALLEVLLQNLLDNAVRHGGAPGPVTVSCRQMADAAVLEVADRGPGVPDDELAQLGNRFYRGMGARGAGSGLGLSIVQRVAEISGADVAYRRGAGGVGLVVEVRFPRTAPA